MKFERMGMPHYRLSDLRLSKGDILIIPMITNPGHSDNGVQYYRYHYQSASGTISDVHIAMMYARMRSIWP
jgi:hypothetical protein